MRKCIVVMLVFVLAVFFSTKALPAEDLPISVSEEQSGGKLSEDRVSGNSDDDGESSESGQSDVEAEIPPVKDTLRPFNRAMFVFNDKVFHYFFKPIYTGYNSMIPVQARVSVKKFLLQYKDARTLFQLSFSVQF